MAYTLSYSGEQSDEALTIALDNESNILKIPQIESDIQTNANKITSLNNDIISLESEINKWNDPLTLCNILYPINSIYTCNGSINPNNLFPGSSWEEINEDERDITYINNYFGTTDLTVITRDDNTKWVPLVLHNINGGNQYYSTVAEALHCDTDGKISNLYLFQQTHDIFKDSLGYYEFILEYPELNNYQRWKQTSNPVTTYDAVSNYTPIHISWTKDNWGGMARQNSSINTKTSCLLSGGIGTANWWYALCSYANYQGGIPGPNSTVVTTFIYFYVRVPQLESANILTNDYNLLKYLGVTYWKRVG